MIKISVIIPVYNAEKYLCACLDSLILQTFKEFEILCIDDGSTDSSLKILETYQQKDSRIRVFSQENKYAGAARNVGIAESVGEYITFADADDFVEQDFLELLYQKSIHNQLDICICKSDKYHEKKQLFQKWDTIVWNRVPKKNIFSREDLAENIFLFLTPTPCYKLIKRDLVIKNNLKFQEIRHANDVYFAMMILLYAERICILDEKCLYHYRIGIRENLQSTKVKQPLNDIRACQKIYNELRSRDMYKEKIKMSFLNYIVVYLVTCMRQMRNDENALLSNIQCFMNEILPIIEDDKKLLSPHNYYIYTNLKKYNKHHLNYREAQEMLDTFSLNKITTPAGIYKRIKMSWEYGLIHLANFTFKKVKRRKLYR